MFGPDLRSSYSEFPVQTFFLPYLFILVESLSGDMGDSNNFHNKVAGVFVFLLILVLFKVPFPISLAEPVLLALVASLTFACIGCCCKDSAYAPRRGMNMTGF